MRIPLSIACLPLMFLVACGSRSGSSSSPTEGLKPFSQRMNESNGYQVDAQGNWVPRNNKRSEFESRGAAGQTTKEYSKKDFSTREQAKKSWWGSKDYGSKNFDGNTDGEHFQQTSRLDGKGARDSGQQANVPGSYQTDNYATSASRESGTGRITKTTDANTTNRRESYDSPDIIDWREQRSLSVDQSKSLLGR